MEGLQVPHEDARRLRHVHREEEVVERQRRVGRGPPGWSGGWHDATPLPPRQKWGTNEHHSVLFTYTNPKKLSPDKR